MRAARAGGGTINTSGAGANVAHDVIVLGAGFTGTALTAHLCRLGKPGVRILLAGNEATLGLAYGAAAPMHLLNVAAGRMSMWPDKPEDFVLWLLANGHAREQEAQGVSLPERFIPRSIYGSYVQDRLREATAETQALFEQRTVHAIRLVGEHAAWQVEFSDGSSATAPVVALCLGNQAGSLPIAPSSIHAGAMDRIISDPWRDKRLVHIAPEDRVLVIGTGLTMVDFVLQREHDGHAGRTIAISRRGLLPEVHALHAEPGVTTPGMDAEASLLSLTRLLRTTIAEHAASGRDWRPIVDGLRPDTQRLWAELRPADQSCFLRHLGTHWGVARHRMPPIAGQRLTAMEQDGRLEILSGRVAGIRDLEGRLDVDLYERGLPTPRQEQVEWVINCTGPGRDPVRSGNTLLRALLDSGIARSDDLRLELDTNADDQVLAANGRPQPGLYALGPVAMGRLYEIVAVPDLRVQCAAVARKIVAR